VVLMTGEPLDHILRLVAEGRLTADEAAPILAALDERQPGRASAAEPPGTGSGLPPGAASTLRIEVVDRGRPVVNLRLPIAVGKLALDRVPGLTGDQVTRIREALKSGYTGSLLEVDDDGDGVRIVLE
jgi:hypothetical protein